MLVSGTFQASLSGTHPPLCLRFRHPPATLPPFPAPCLRTLPLTGCSSDHSVSAFRNVQPELPSQRGPVGAGRSKTSIRVNYTDLRQLLRMYYRSSWLEWSSFPVSCCANFMTSDFLYTSHSTFSFLISAFCWQNCTFFKIDRRTQSLGAFWLLSLCY